MPYKWLFIKIFFQLMKQSTVPPTTSITRGLDCGLWGSQRMPIELSSARSLCEHIYECVNLIVILNYFHAKRVQIERARHAKVGKKGDRMELIQIVTHFLCHFTRFDLPNAAEEEKSALMVTRKLIYEKCELSAPLRIHKPLRLTTDINFAWY